MKNIVNNGIFISGGTVEAKNITNSIEQLKENQEQLKNSEQNYLYDIGISFAGEERLFASQLAKSLTKSNLEIFYDEIQTTKIWGEDLPSYLTKTYFEQCKYCIVLLSNHYMKKKWTQIEWNSIKVREYLAKNDLFLLPIIIDEELIKTLDINIGFINANQLEYEEIVELILNKVRA